MTEPPIVYAPRGYATGTAADDAPELSASLYPSLAIAASDDDDDEEGPRGEEASVHAAAPAVLYKPRGHAAVPSGVADTTPAISASNYPSLLPPPNDAEPTSGTPPDNEAEPNSPFQYAPRGHAAVGEPSASDAHAEPAAINADNYPSLMPTTVDEPPSEAPAQAPTVQIATTALTTPRQMLGSRFARWRSRFKRRR